MGVFAVKIAIKLVAVFFVRPRFGFCGGFPTFASDGRRPVLGFVEIILERYAHLVTEKLGIFQLSARC